MMSEREIVMVALVAAVPINVYFGTKGNASLTVAAFGAMVLILMGITG